MLLSKVIAARRKKLLKINKKSKDPVPAIQPFRRGANNPAFFHPSKIRTCDLQIQASMPDATS
jgi:hypothetical protein